MYGGLGTHVDFGLHETSHYVAPTVAWILANGTSFHISPGFGRTRTSASFLLRFGVSYEVGQGGSLVQRAASKAGPLNNPLENDAIVQRAGAKLYKRECSACHGENREGSGKAPPLAQPEVYQAGAGTLF
jgi:mono/diheme cytochrome c family protein